MKSDTNKLRQRRWQPKGDTNLPATLDGLAYGDYHRKY